MNSETTSALTFIIAELISVSILLILAYNKSQHFGFVLSGIIQGILISATFLSAMGLKEWLSFAVMSFLMIAGGLIGAGIALGILAYTSAQKEKVLPLVDAKAI